MREGLPDGGTPTPEDGGRPPEPFFEIRIETKSFLQDFKEQVRNRVGLRQRGYEEMVDTTVDELLDEVHGAYEVEWFRVDVDMVGRGAISVTVYGQGVPR